jgi:ATP-dependent Clp protease protease subunit
MSLRKLPDIQAFLKSEKIGKELSPIPSDNALARWKPGIQAATADGSDVISIYDVIGQDFFGDGVSSKRVGAALRSIGAKDVTVHINSPGGDFFEGIAIYSMLKEHQHKVTVKVMGLAASVASVIAMAGDDVQISDVGFLMLHNAWCVAIGNRHDMREAADVLDPFDAAMADLYAKHAEVDLKTAVNWMDKETWFGGPAAVDAGLAHSLLASTEVKESTTANTKQLSATRRIEAALLRANPHSTRAERRSLLSDCFGGDKPSAVATAKPSASERPDTVDSGLVKLLHSIHSVTGRAA